MTARTSTFDGNDSSIEEIFPYEGSHVVTEVDGEHSIVQTFFPNRVFVNQVDSYHGSYISKYIASKEVGASDNLLGEDQQPEENPFEINLRPAKELYEVIGTSEALSAECLKPDHVLAMIHKDDAEYDENILKCGYVVFDISSDRCEIDEAARVLDMLDKHVQELRTISPNTSEVRTFILVSSFMTWAKTKPPDPRQPELPLTEADYRRRRPHPNFKPHIELEKETVTVGRKHKGYLRTAVIAAGIVYGDRNEVFDFAFKMAFYNHPELPVFYPGTNNLPTIHVQDLAACVHNLIVEPPTLKKMYFLAVEPVGVKLNQAVKVVSKALGFGRTVIVPQEHAFFLPTEMHQHHFDQLVSNLYMEPVRFAEVPFQNEMGFAAMGQRLAKEFKEAHGLRPVRIMIHGPPGVGKTEVAKMVAKYYNAHHLTVDGVIKESIEKLKSDIERIEQEKLARAERAKESGSVGEGGEDDEGDPLEDVQAMKHLLQEVEDNMAANPRGRLDDSYVNKFFREKLLSPPCQNQGYVLDGWPKEISQAKAVFSLGGPLAGEGAEEAPETSFDETIMPENIFSLMASDYYLCRRIMELPQCEVEGTHYTEEEMLRRLSEYRIRSTDVTTVLNYFDDNERHPRLINAEEIDTTEDIFALICERVGPPVTFVMTKRERERARLAELERRKKREDEEAQKELQRQEKIRRQREQAMEEWTMLFEKLRAEEEALLASQGAPLRHYIARYVLPTLTRGLLEVARMRPTDPIDYLAEYLFRENPEGKMFDPSWNQTGEELMQHMEFVLHPPTV